MRPAAFFGVAPLLAWPPFWRCRAAARRYGRTVKAHPMASCCRRGRYREAGGHGLATIRGSLQCPWPMPLAIARDQGPLANPVPVRQNARGCGKITPLICVKPLDGFPPDIYLSRHYRGRMPTRRNGVFVPCPDVLLAISPRRGHRLGRQPKSRLAKPWRRAPAGSHPLASWSVFCIAISRCGLVNGGIAETILIWGASRSRALPNSGQIDNNGGRAPCRP